jgi:hypothetical protein
MLIFIAAGLAWHSIDNPVWNFFRADDDAQLNWALHSAVYTSVTYSLLSVIGASIVSNTSAKFWNTTHLGVEVVISITLCWMLVASLVPMFFFLLRAVPRSFWAGRRVT